MASGYLSKKEQALLARAAAEGDKGAWEKLEKSFGKALIGYITGRIGDQEEAEKLARDTWSYVWEKISTYDPKYSFYTFLLNFARIIIKRRFYSGRSLLLRMSDLKDLASLVVRLRDAQDPLSQYLRARFSPKTQQVMDKYDSASPPDKALQKALIDELNRLLRGDLLYDKQRFAQVELTEEARRLIKGNPEGEDRILLNRLLLEWAYPREIEIKKSRKKREKQGDVIISPANDEPDADDSQGRGDSEAYPPGEKSAPIVDADDDDEEDGPPGPEDVLPPSVFPQPDIGTIFRELLSIIFRCCGKPHELIAFGFNKLLEWNPQEIVREHSVHPLEQLALELREVYCSQFHPDGEEIASHFSPLLEKMERYVREVYTEPEYQEKLRDAMNRKVGLIQLRDVYGRNAEASISDWTYKVKDRAKRAVEEGILCRE